MGWTQMSDQCVHYLCRTIQPTIEHLTLTGFRQGMTDECKFERWIFEKNCLKNIPF